MEKTFTARKSPFCDRSGAILVAGGDRTWVGRMSDMLEAMGYQTLTAFGSQQALNLMSRTQISTVIIESELPDGDGQSLVQYLSSCAARRGQHLNAILATMQPTQDVSMGLIGPCNAYMIDKSCEPKELDSLLQLILTPPIDFQSITSLSDQIQLLSKEICSLKCSLEPVIGKDVPPVDPPRKPRQIDADLVRKLIRAEAARSSVIGGKILGDPAWNVLLDLLLASLEGRRVAVSSACIVAGTATTTALRLINRMISDGVLVRIPDEADGRRDYLIIEPDVEMALKAYLFDLTQL